MKTIEFLGIPGSGKSYVRKYLLTAAEELAPQAVYIEDLIEKCTKEQRQDAKKAGIATYGNLLGHFLVSKHFELMPFEHRRMTIEWYQNLFRNYLLADASKDTFSHCIFDEGLVHRSNTTFVLPGVRYNQLPKDPVEAYLRQIPISDYTIYLHSSVENAHSRILNRGLPKRIQDASEDEVLQFLRDSEQHVTFCEHILKDRGARIIKMDNFGTLEEFREQIYELAKEILVS